MRKVFFSFVCLVFIFVACNKIDNNKELPPSPEQLGNGFFILNQGNFTAGNSSLSFFNESTNTITKNLFYKLNGAPLGDVAQSMTFHNGNAFIVVNNSAHIYAIDAKTGIFKGKIDQLQSPRFLTVIDDSKAYVSDFQYKGMTVLDLQTLRPLGNIETGKTTETMVKIDDEVFVANWSNYNQTYENNTVQVIDARFDALIDSILVAKEPNSMVVDKNKHLWVLCSGGYLNEEIPALFEIDPMQRGILQRFNFPHAEMSPEQLNINHSGDTLFFLNRDVFRMPITSNQLPENPFIEANNHNYFALGIHPLSSEIILSDALSYVQNGLIFRHRPDGMLIDSVQAGIIPGFFGFKN